MTSCKGSESPPAEINASPDADAGANNPDDDLPKTTSSISSLSHRLIRLAEKLNKPVRHKTNDVTIILDVYYHEEKINIKFELAVEVSVSYTKSQLYSILYSIISNNLWTDALVITDYRFHTLLVQVDTIHANGLEVVLAYDDDSV